MRYTAANLLYDAMEINTDVYILTADLGFGLWDRIRERWPNRFYNIGSSEQLMLGIAVGLALSKKMPVCYSITPFLLYRPAEWIRNYLIHENISVKLMGGGRDEDYKEDGFTHWDTGCPFPELKTYAPTNIPELNLIFYDWLYNKEAAYLNLRR